MLTAEAVALVPLLAAYVGSGDAELGLRAAFLFASNLLCIKIARLLAFLLQGLPPRRWRITAGILAVCVAVLALIVAVITGRVVMVEGYVLEPNRPDDGAGNLR